MQKFDIFRAGLLKFIEAGYLYIGMDHFAKPGDELSVSQQNRTLHRNFQGYTTKSRRRPLRMGITAISGIQDAYAQNFRDIPSWEKAVAERGLATMRGYQLSTKIKLRRAVISRLLCHTRHQGRNLARVPASISMSTLPKSFAASNRPAGTASCSSITARSAPPGSPHFHPQPGHGFRSVPGTTAAQSPSHFFSKLSESARMPTAL